MTDTTSMTNTDQLFYVRAWVYLPGYDSIVRESVRAESALEALIHFLEAHDLDYDLKELVDALIERYLSYGDWQGIHQLMDEGVEYERRHENAWTGDIYVEKAPSGEVQTASEDCRWKARVVFERAKELQPHPLS